MKTYTGIKQIKATPMARGEYHKYRGFPDMVGENPTDEGYLVEYLDSPNSNHPNHENYISWSPKDVFERSYQNTEGGMSFEAALYMMKQGYSAYRPHWGYDYLQYCEGEIRIINHPADPQDYPEASEFNITPADFEATDWAVMS